MAAKTRPIYPILVVLASISIIEVAMTFLYPKLQADWERIPILALIVLIPFCIISGFIYVWIKKPGHLYPPSEFGTGRIAERKLAYF